MQMTLRQGVLSAVVGSLIGLLTLMILPAEAKNMIAQATFGDMSTTSEVLTRHQQKHDSQAPLPPLTSSQNQAFVTSQFEKLDRNRDENLTLGEYRALSPERDGALNDEQRAYMRQLFEQAFALLDQDGNTQVSRAEFMAYHTERFNQMDVNGDGTVTEDEIAQDTRRLQQVYQPPQSQTQPQPETGEAAPAQ